MNAEELTEDERIDLMRFLCSFAWADGEVQAEERAVLERILAHSGLSRERRAAAMSWLIEPPDMEGFDFAAISPEKRSLFLDLAFEVASAHGGLAGDELRQLQMFMSVAEGPD